MKIAKWIQSVPPGGPQPVREPANARRFVRPSGAVIAAFLAAALLCLAPGGSKASRSYSPLDVKATLIHHIIEFIRWPANDDSNPPDSAQRTMVVCILGDASMAKRLGAVVQGTGHRHHPTLVRNLGTRGPTTGCQVLFIGTGYVGNVGSLLHQLADTPVLTVSDTPGYGTRGVAINFYSSSESIRFEVNRSTLRRAGLHASYKLLSLARIIGDD